MPRKTSKSKKNTAESASSAGSHKRERRGAKAVQWRFTDEQDEYLCGLYPEFEEVVRRENPDLERYNRKVGDWKKEKSVAVMGMPLFASLVTEDKPVKGWEKVRFESPL